MINLGTIKPGTMRKAGVALLLAGLVLAIVRLCTGIVYRADEPLTALVLRAPALAVERTETATRPLERDLVIDSDEPDLVYGALYLRLMAAAPVAIAVMSATGLAMLALARRRA